jgi:hypothetical protein
MSNMQSSLSLDLAENTELQAYLKGKQPGDDYCLTVKGKVIDLTTENFTGGIESVVEADDEAGEDPAEEASETPAEESAEDSKRPDMGGILAKAMSGMKGQPS